MAARDGRGGQPSQALIVDAIRTPIGRAGRGSLRDVRADDLAAIPLRALRERNPGADLDVTDDILMGCGVQAGEQGHNVGRDAALLAGYAFGVPATTVNRYCASSLQALRMAFHAIRAGEGHQYVAAGVEAVSRYPAHPPYDPHPALAGGPEARCDAYVPMGLTAENVAESRSITRERQDEWALISHRRAVAARADGRFDAEIVPVALGDGTEVRHDDGPRADTSAERLAALQPVFKPGGTVTAGNSCPLNDGAAAVLVVSGERARERGLRPLARVVATAVAGVRPEEMGLGPLPAVARLLRQSGMSLADVDVVELNEAFAAQVVACRDEWGLDWERLNPFGGAIALGHPFGMTGARLVTTLLNGLRAGNGTYGIAAACVAGGMGQAVLVERLA